MNFNKWWISINDEYYWVIYKWWWITMIDAYQWMMIINEWWILMNDDYQWMMSFNERWIAMKDAWLIPGLTVALLVFEHFAQLSAASLSSLKELLEQKTHLQILKKYTFVYNFWNCNLT